MTDARHGEFEWAEHNLLLCSENNDGETYLLVRRTLTKFYKKGTYDRQRAKQYIERQLVCKIARMLCADEGTELRYAYPKTMRLSVADKIEESWFSDMQLGYV